jgi:hypothetical protein
VAQRLLRIGDCVRAGAVECCAPCGPRGGNIPTPGSNPAFPQAWNNASGYEVADLCGGSGQLTKGAKSWTVTQYYVNSLGRCSTGNYTSP